LANRILERRGFGNQRVNQYWLSGAEAEKLVKSVEDTVEKISRVGINPIKLAEKQEMKKELSKIPTA